MTNTELKRKLAENAGIGLDCSPGDPVAAAALDRIEELEVAVESLEKELRCEQNWPRVD